MLNKTDSEKLLTAIKALHYTLTEGIDLAKDIYSFAFSNTFALNGSPAEILDIILNHDDFKSKSAEFSAEAPTETEANIKDMTVSSVEEIGDLLITKDYVYIFDGKELIKLIKPFTERCGMIDTKNIKCAVLRPLNILDYIPYTSEKDLELSDGQKAVIETAKQYLLRGYRMQYDDTTTGPHTYRWRIRKVAPEDYTKDLHGYSNCAAFSLDSHYFSWGYNTESMCTAQLETENTENIISWEITGNETEAEQEKIKTEFFANLEPADIINVRYSFKSGGHAMLYVGNGQIIHSSGRNYCYDEENPFETYEPTVRVMNVLNLFKYGDRRCVFENIKNLAIVRPLNKFDGKVPANTLNRLKNLKGLVTEKLCSMKKYNSVNRGDEITYTFSVYNTNDYETTVEIEDTVPDYTSIISGNLHTSLSIQPNETKTFSYTVRVNDDAPYGTFITSNNGKVGGAVHTCTPILIAKTFTKEEQESISEKAFKINCTSPVDFVNELYGKNILSVSSIDEITEKLFTADEKGNLTQNKNGEIASILVPTCFGGRKISASRFEDELVRFMRPFNLIAGDIIISVKDIGKTIYLVTNKGILDLSFKELLTDTEKFTEHIIATNQYFAVLRPSKKM